MKYSFLIISLLLFFHCKGQIFIGPTMGGHVNWVNFKDNSFRDTYETSYGLAYHTGVSIAFKMSKSVFLQSSILYSTRYKHVTSKEDADFKHDAKYTFIDMPIYFMKEYKLRLGKNRYYNVYGGIGPLVSYWLGGKGYIKSSELNENGINPPNYDINYKLTFDRPANELEVGKMYVEDANRVQLGLNFSAGIALEPNNAGKFLFNIDYQLGHSFFSRDKDGDFGLPGVLYYQDELQSRFYSLGFSVHYFIDLKTENRKKGKSTFKIK